MAALIADLYVILAVLSAWVALRFVPLTLRRAALGEWERAGLAFGMVIFHGFLAVNHAWFYLARVRLGPSYSYYSTHWIVVLAGLGMILACLIWMVTLDRAPPRRLPFLIFPIAAAFGAAWILPP